MIHKTDTPKLPTGRPYFHKPTISPDGRYVAFVYAADIWQVSIEGGIAERLTVHSADNYNPRYSPDGSLLAFSSYRTGGGDVYVLPMQGGGDVQRLTYHSTQCSVEDWAIDGQSLFFTSRREQLGGKAIYRVMLAGGTPQLIFVEPYEDCEYVHVAPDGTALVFNTTYNPWWRLGPNPYGPNRIWLLSLAPLLSGAEMGSEPDLASEQAREALTPYPRATPTLLNPSLTGRYPLWAPDGQGIYVVSDQHEGENIWYQPLDGSAARQVTHFTSGRLLLPSIARQREVIVFEHEWQLWRMDTASGEVAPIPIQVRADTKMIPVRTEHWSRNFSELQLSPDGKKLAFVVHGQVFADFADKETDRELRRGPAFRITNTHAREGQIIWTPDSKSIIYISDRHGEQDIFRYDFATRKETRLTHDPSPRLLPCCSPDGAWLAYIRNFETIDLLNLKTGDIRPFAQGNFVRSYGLAWSPDSQWLAFLAHDERFFSNVSVQHREATEAHQITFLSNIMGFGLMWSSNGQYLIFTSGQYRMESQIVRVDLRPLTPFLRETEFEKLFKDEKDKEEKAPKGDEQPTPAEPEEPEQPTPEEPAAPAKAAKEPQTDEPETPEVPVENESAPAAEQDDKKPQENEQTKTELITIVFEGIERRLSFLTPIQMDAQAYAISHDSKDLLFMADVAGKENVWTLPMDEPRRDHPPLQVTGNNSRKQSIQFAPNDKTFCYLEDGQITIRKFPSGRDPVIIYTRAEVTVDFDQEKSQIFDEAWRMLRDNFYDPTFRGQDWGAIRERFSPLAAGAQTYNELTTILNLMVGELRTSHLGAFFAGDTSGSDGYTGLLFDPTEQANRGVYRIAALVPDTPVALGENPPRIGEYLVAINDTPLQPNTCLDQLLQRTVGRRVVLRLAATPDGTQARDIAIRPIGRYTYGDLRYRAWVATNKHYVHRISNGRLGYVHVEAMSYHAYQEFLINLDAETYRKEGLILDIRYNSGGHIATFILDVLTRRSVVLSGFRGRLSTDEYHHSGNRALNKPTILVTNESSASNAEIFTEIYRRLGLGKVVGKPTAGAVIGTIDRVLLSGIRFRLPTISISTPEGENLEGTGRAVDCEVEQPLGAWVQGKDYQLDAAVASLLESLGKPHQDHTDED